MQCWFFDFDEDDTYEPGIFLVPWDDQGSGGGGWWLVPNCWIFIRFFRALDYQEPVINARDRIDTFGSNMST